MLMKDEERVFVSEEIKDIISFGELKNKKEDNFTLSIGDVSYDIIRLKQSKKKIKISFICNFDFVKKFYKKGNDIAYIKLDEDIVYTLNIRKDFVYLIFNKSTKNFAKLCVINNQESNNGI